MTLMARTAALTNYLEVSQQLHLNPQHQLSQFGLSQSMLQNPDLPIPMLVVIMLLQASAQASGCDTFGLRMAESRQLSNFGAISLLLSHQPTLRDALNTIVQYRHLLNESLALHIEEMDGMVTLREEIISDSPVSMRQCIELAIGVLHRLCGALLGSNWRPQCVYFTHDAPANLQVHRRVFGCKIMFNSEFNGIACSATHLYGANPNADLEMARYARGFVESIPGTVKGSTLNEVRQAIYLLLPLGRAGIGQIAQSIGLNTRTLQRKLEENGVTFSDLSNEVRRELLQRYMENPRYSMSQISDLLGYSTQSSFTRWFTSQYGVSPASWRRKYFNQD